MIGNKFNSKECGAILVLALMFLALLGFLSGTVMQTSVFELRMARNHQFQVEAFQLAQGVASSISEHPDNFLVTSNLNHVICKAAQITPGCSASIAALDPNLVTLPLGATINYKVERMGPLFLKELPVRLGQSRASSSVAYDAAMFETKVEIDATSIGRGAAAIVLGVAVLTSSIDQ
ncbi:MAG: hypothetical protein ACJAUG_002327 [Halioglobus sp.]